MSGAINPNIDLVGRVYRNGDDGVIRYRVTAVDEEFTSLVHAENLTTGAAVCALADFVRPYLEPAAAERGRV